MYLVGSVMNQNSTKIHRLVETTSRAQLLQYMISRLIMKKKKINSKQDL